MSEETLKDFDRDDEYHKMSLDQLKTRFLGWLEYNFKEMGKEPDIHIKEKDKGLIIKITEEGGEDFMDDGTEYYMILKPLEDENEMEDEIEKEKQYNKEHGVLVREAFPFPTGE
jgi:hypothetical protein